MKVVKGVSFFVYLLFTACVVFASAVLFQASAQLDSKPYGTLSDYCYLVQKTRSVTPAIPKDSLLIFQKDDAPYPVGCYVVYIDGDDHVSVGAVTRCDNYTGTPSYTLDVNGEVKNMIPHSYLGRAVAYSNFLGALARATDSLAGRLLVCVLPSSLLVIFLIVLIFMAIFHRSAERAERHTEEDEDLFVNLSRDRFLGTDDPPRRAPQKTYFNPDAHTELIKYNWLKEAAGLRDEEPSEQTEPPAQPEAPKPAEEPAQPAEPEQTAEPEQPAEPEPESEPQELQIAILPDEPDEPEPKHRAGRAKKSKNDRLIADMRKLLDMDEDE